MSQSPQTGGFEEEPPDEEELHSLSDEEFCYLTTTGRITGLPHEIEIWFAAVPEKRTLYFLSGGRDRSDWVKNLKREPRVVIVIRGRSLTGTARIIEGQPEEDATARDMLVAKYECEPGGLAEWRENSLPVAISLP